MRLLKIRPGKRGLVYLAFVGGVGTAALFLIDWTLSSAPDVEPSPADVVSLRFPPERSSVPATAQTEPAAAAAPPADHDILSAPIFRPSLVVRPDWPSTGPATGQAREYADQGTAEPSTTASVPSPTLPPKPAARSPRASRAAALFNDAQIASMKGRLKLTQEQESYWVPVESALRDISWRHAHARPGTTALPTIDPDSLQRLQLAAAPLIMHLREEQKRELRLLAHIVGLDKLVSQF